MFFRRNIGVQRFFYVVASFIGTHICFDFASTKPMIDMHFGHHVIVLVEMDVTYDIRYKNLVERKGFAFFTEQE